MVGLIGYRADGIVFGHSPVEPPLVLGAWQGAGQGGAHRLARRRVETAKGLLVGVRHELNMNEQSIQRLAQILASQPDGRGDQVVQVGGLLRDRERCERIAGQPDAIENIATKGGCIDRPLRAHLWRLPPKLQR